LFGKYSGTTATAVATTMDATSIGLLVTNVGKIAVGGITGTLTLTKAQFATTDVAAALNSTATVSVDTWTDADSVNAAKIDNVVTGATCKTAESGLIYG
jgi:L-lactate utilization protein LutC